MKEVYTDQGARPKETMIRPSPELLHIVEADGQRKDRRRSRKVVNADNTREDLNTIEKGVVDNFILRDEQREWKPKG